MAPQALQARQAQEAFRWLEKTSQQSKANQELKRFIHPDVVRSHFDKDRIKDILSATYDGKTHVAMLARDIVGKGYTLILLILLRLDKVGFIDEFMRQSKYSDRFLPFTYAEGFPTGVPFDQFQAQQQMYCAESMHRGEATYEDVYILPIIEKERIAEGSTAIVHRVKILPEYDNLVQDPNVDPSERHVYVTKTFRSAADYKAEKKAYEAIEPEGLQTESLLKYFGCYMYNGTYTVILEHANSGTLETFMEKTRPPERREDKWALWRGLMKLGQAVHRIHNANGWHQDINTRNVVLHHRSQNGTWAYDAKLVDLGLSHFRDATQISADFLAPDNYGTKAYGAPQCYRLPHDEFELGTRLYVRNNVDVFSLGGVLLEAAVWMEEDWGGVQRFRDDRLAEARQVPMEEGIAFFHDKSQLLKCVDRKIESLSRRENRECRLTARICDELIKGMLCPDYEHRMSAESLWRKFIPILDATDPKTDNLVQATSGLRLHNTGINNAYSAGLDASRPVPGRSGGILSGEDPVSRFSESPPESPYSRAHEMINGLPRVKTLYGSEDGDWEAKAESSTGHTQVKQELRRKTMPGTELEKQKRPSRHGTTGDIRETSSQGTITRRKKNPHLSIVEAISIMHEISDRRRPSYSQEQREQLAKLNDRDHSFILDNSYSTAKCWSSIRILFRILATILDGSDPDGMELRFTTTNFSTRDFNIQRLIDIVDSTTPAPDPDVNRALTDAVRGHRGRFRERPLSVYIMTDGAWEWGPTQILLELVEELKKSGLERQSIGIQFISFGNDQIGLQHLQQLDDMADKKRLDLPHDIVDTVSSNGNVLKMLLGSFDPSYDEDAQ